jgi:hypothetical protein
MVELEVCSGALDPIMDISKMLVSLFRDHSPALNC